MKCCPVCQREFNDSAVHCGFDGSKLEQIAARPAPTPESFRPLSELLSPESPLAIERAVKLAMAACDALAEAHRGGRSLGTLSPRDLSVDEAAGRARLAERDYRPDRKLPESLAPYLSPEAAQGQPVAAASDVYSLGAILYEMLTGRPPFRASSAAALVIKQILERPRPPRDLRPEISPSLQQAVLRALEKEAGGRPATPAAFRQELEQALAPAEADNVATLAAPPAAPPRLGPTAAAPAFLPAAADAQADPMIGRTLAGRYRLLAVRGKGVTGTIYQAEDLRLLNRPVAIKIFRPELLTDETGLDRFQREAVVAARLRHPNAVTIYDCGETEDGILYLAMEYINGRSFSALVGRNGNLPLDRVVKINRQLADVLHAAHGLGIIHCDLTLYDVMVEEGSDRVKLVDFGLSNRIRDAYNASETRRAGIKLGSVKYMSPEQLAGGPVDARSDLYSLATIIYRLLTGVLPFDGKNDEELIRRRLSEPPRPLSVVMPGLTVPLAVERVVMKALAQDPAERYPSVVAFADALDAAFHSVVSTRTGREYILVGPQSGPIFNTAGLPYPPDSPPPPAYASPPAPSADAPLPPAPVPIGARRSGAPPVMLLLILGGALLLAVLAAGALYFFLPRRAADGTPAPAVESPPPVAPDSPPPPPETPPATSGVPMWLILAILGAGLGGGGLTVFLLWRSRAAGRGASLPGAGPPPQLRPAPIVVPSDGEVPLPAEAALPVGYDEGEKPTLLEPEPPPVKQEVFKRCPTCDVQFPISVRFCVHDGTSLVEERRAAPAKEKEGPSFYDLQTLDPVKRCPACGVEYPLNKKFCRHDGKLLVEFNPAEAQDRSSIFKDPIRIGQYECYARLGEGGMGVVYKARHVHLNRVCAVKVLLPRMAAQEEVVKLFRREAQLASSITHPNSVIIYDYGQEANNLLYLAMEFIPGKTLAEIIKSKERPPVALPLGRALNLLRQICDALDTAHRAGIVHRDLKPQNIMICERADKPEMVKVVDFGIARSLTPAGEYETITGIVGTPAYMSPEQAAGEPNLDGRTDIFSLGVIAYQMLTGQLPFPAEGPPLKQVMQRADLTDPPPPPNQARPGLNLPAGVEQAILRALTPDRARRMKSVGEFVEEIDRVMRMN